MNDGRNENAPGTSRRKRRHCGGISALAGLLMGMMGSVLFYTRGLHAFKLEEDGVGAAYMGLTFAFPVMTTVVGWLMETKEPDSRPAPCPEGGTSAPQKEDPPPPGENQASGDGGEERRRPGREFRGGSHRTGSEKPQTGGSGPQRSTTSSSSPETR